MKSRPSVENLFVYFGPQLLVTNIYSLWKRMQKIATRTLPKIEPKKSKETSSPFSITRVNPSCYRSFKGVTTLINLFPDRHFNSVKVISYHGSSYEGGGQLTLFTMWKGVCLWLSAISQSYNDQNRVDVKGALPRGLSQFFCDIQNHLEIEGNHNIILC